MEKTLRELEREALLLAFGKGGSLEHYWYLKGKADAELSAFIDTYKEKNIFKNPDKKEQKSH